MPVEQVSIPVLIQIAIACGFAGVTLSLSVAIGRSASSNATKDSAYECGMLPLGESQPRFSVKFYLVAMIFIIFDVEVVFLYPWAVSFQKFLDAGVGLGVLGVVTVFIIILAIGLIYDIKKGGLEFD